MAMRYLIRRPNSEDFNDIRKDVPDLDKKLGNIGADVGTAGAKYRRDMEINLDNHRTVTYQFLPRKKGTAWVWTCPSVELVAEDDNGIFALCDRLKAPYPTHLTAK